MDEKHLVAVRALQSPLARPTVAVLLAVGALLIAATQDAAILAAVVVCIRSVL